MGEGGRRSQCTVGSHAQCTVGSHALLVVLGGLIVGVDDGVGGHTVGIVGLGPGVDGVDVIEHGHGEKSEHLRAENELDKVVGPKIECCECQPP